MQRDDLARRAAEERFLASREPSRRFVQDAGVAALIAFLCGPKAAEISGAALSIDGAWAAGH